VSEIQKEISVLWDLKKVADQIHRVQVDLVRIPEEILKLQNNLEKAKSAFEGEKSKIEMLEKKVREAERDTKIEEDYLAKSEARMKDVKNNTTLQAAQKEQQDRKRTKTRLEEDAAKATAEMEAKKAQFPGYETQFQEVAKKTLEECAVLEADLAKLRSEITLLEGKQQDLTKGLSINISTIYTRLARGGQGAPIAQVDEGLCLSCHMRVRPQLYNEVIGFKQIHQCSGCRKLLVYPIPDGTAKALDA